MYWLLACLAAGAVSACGFAPLDLWPLTLIGTAFLLFAVERAPGLRSALARGWWFGLGQFCVGLNWIATAFSYQSNMPAWLGWVAVVLLSLYLAVYPAVATGLAWRWAGGHRLRLVLVFAAAWIVTEFLRGVLFTGFPWNPIGVSLLLTPASIFSTLAGTYALSGLAALIAGTLYLLARRQWRTGGGVALGAAAAAGVAALLAPSPGAGPGAPVRIVQPNIDQQIKYDPAHFERQWRRLEELTGRPSDRPPAETGRMIFWPEVAIPDLLSIDEPARMRIAALLGPRDVMLTGASELVPNAAGRVVGIYNSLFARRRAWRHSRPLRQVAPRSLRGISADAPAHDRAGAQRACAEQLRHLGGTGTALDRRSRLRPGGRPDLLRSRLFRRGGGSQRSPILLVQPVQRRLVRPLGSSAASRPGTACVRSRRGCRYCAPRRPASRRSSMRAGIWWPRSAGAWPA
jgi:apolipoprotein N-acyltransferase